MLGELPQEAGTLEVNGSIAYVPQQAWIVNATLKDNILMGAPYDEARFQASYFLFCCSVYLPLPSPFPSLIYHKAVTAACALDADIEMLDGGIYTQIGEKGINISGGQQQRYAGPLYTSPYRF